MSTLLRGRDEFAGSVFFRGTLPPRAMEFAHLRSAGIHVAPLTANEASHWALSLRHPQWGEAEVYALRDVPLPPRFLVEMDPWLTAEEREQILIAGNSVTVRCKANGDFILKQRKASLRFVEAIMGSDGLGAVDHTSQRFWSPAQLREELSHDADLDIQSLYTIHAVTNDQMQDESGDAVIDWAHTHGLAELGGFDFDILRPGGDFQFQVGDIVRALAFMIVEGRVKRGDERVHVFEPGGDVALVDAATFQRRAPREQSALREDPTGDHTKNRVVLCEPRTGFFSKFFGRIRASHWLMQPMPDEGLIKFTNAASDLMAERAKKTYTMFRALAEELAEFEFTVIAKLGYRVDGGDETDREHLWFEVQRFEDSRIDATLLNEPFHIERMKKGQRATHPTELLSDWMIMTPAGMINPRQTAALRTIRAHREEILEAMRKHRESR